MRTQEGIQRIYILTTDSTEMMCGSCRVEQRKSDVSIKGCCVFVMRLLLVEVENNRYLNHQPHLEIKEFKLSPISLHLHVSPEVW